VASGTIHQECNYKVITSFFAHNMAYRTRLVRIGNSRGVRIAKPWLEQTGITDEVEIEVFDDRLVIHAVREPRAGWDVAFAQMAQAGDDALLDPGLAESEWDRQEWQWPMDEGGDPE
jgi:antitoxin MazE